MIELSIADLEEELMIRRKQEDFQGELRVLRSLGSAFQKNRQFTKAASCFSKALSRVQEKGSDKDKAVVHASLGSVYWEMAQLKKAMAQFQSAMDIQKHLEVAPVQARILILMGISYWRQCQWEEGLHYFSEARDLRSLHPLETETPTKNDEYSFLQEVIERGVVTLQNRIRLGREQGDALKTLQPLFAMIPLYLFTAKTNEIDLLIQEVISLAEQLQKKDILNTIPKLQALISRG